MAFWIRPKKEKKTDLAGGSRPSVVPAEEPVTFLPPPPLPPPHPKPGTVKSTRQGVEGEGEGGGVDHSHSLQRIL